MRASSETHGPRLLSGLLQGVEGSRWRHECTGHAVHTTRDEVPAGEGALLTVPGWRSYRCADARAAGASAKLRGLPPKVSIAATDAAAAVEHGPAESSSRPRIEVASRHLTRSGTGETAAAAGIGRAPGKRLPGIHGSSNCRLSDCSATVRNRDGLLHCAGSGGSEER